MKDRSHNPTEAQLLAFAADYVALCSKHNVCFSGGFEYLGHSVRNMTPSFHYPESVSAAMPSWSERRQRYVPMTTAQADRRADDADATEARERAQLAVLQEKYHSLDDRA
jgi:hypothetical protein